jgi:replicative DNA helicase
MGLIIMLTEKQITSIEQQFLIELLYNDKIRHRFSGIVSPECFFVGVYGDILKTMQDLIGKGEDINPFSLSKGKDEISTHVMELVAAGDSVVEYETHYLAYQIWQCYNQRRMVALADEVKLRLNTEPPAAVMAWSADQASSIVNPLDVVDNVDEDIKQASEAAMSDQNRVTPTGLECFDAEMGGLDKGAMTLLAAHPAAGKTALALNISWRVATKHGKVLFFSAEEAKAPLWWRIFSMQTGIPITAFRKGLSDSQRQEFSEKKGSFNSRPLKIIDSISGLDDIRAKATAEHAQEEIKLLVIDSASMIDALRGESEVEKANRIGWQTTRLAKELDIPVLLLAHVNNEGIKSKAGGLTNVYGGQGLVKPAQVVLELRQNKEDVGKGVIVDAHIAKNRYGETGKRLQFDFIGELMRFMPK